MASKKETSVLRGAKLAKKAIEKATSTGLFVSPEPVPSGLAKKMVLPNGEAISASMKALFVTDVSWIGIDFDDEEGEIEGMSLEDAVEEAFGEEAVPAFGEAFEALTEDVVYFGGDFSRPACLYCGTPDDSEEYPVILMSWENGVAKVGGFVPFDVWLAQEVGLLERGKEIGDVPSEYSALPKAASEANFDGRVVFTPEAGEASDDEDEDDEDDE